MPTLGVIGTSKKPDEHRFSIHPDHLRRFKEEVRRNLVFEAGYGEAFGLTDAEFSARAGGVASRAELLGDVDAVSTRRCLSRVQRATSVGTPSTRTTSWQFIAAFCTHCSAGASMGTTETGTRRSSSDSASGAGAPSMRSRLAASHDGGARRDGETLPRPPQSRGHHRQRHFPGPGAAARVRQRLSCLRAKKWGVGLLVCRVSRSLSGPYHA